MTRSTKGRLQLSLLFLQVILIASCHGFGERGREPQQFRNLLILSIDTLRADHVSAYGHDRATTPRIDGLASEGTLFLEARAHSSHTIPSTASLFTSRLPLGHGAYSEDRVKNFSRKNPPRRIRHDITTLAETLAQAGFRTGLFSGNVNVTEQFERGFDVVGGRPLEAADSLTTMGIDWINTEPDQRFFAHLQYMDVHQPIRPPEPYFSMFPVDDGRERGEQHHNWRFGRVSNLKNEDFQSYRNHKLALYDGALRFIDEQITGLFTWLEQAGLAGTTLIVITSDHGEEFWDHAEVERQHGSDPRGIWGIGHGHSLYDEQLRVPLVIWGETLARGRTVDCPIGQIDIAPTVLELLAVPIPEDFAGTSRKDLVTDKSWSGKCPPEKPLIADALAWGLETRAVVRGGWKLIARIDGSMELYDLRTDPGEQRDLSAERADIVGHLSERLADYVGTAAEMGAKMEIDEEMERNLRALGYID